MVLDLMHVQNFHYHLVNEIYTLLFLVWTIAYQDILIIKKDILVLGGGPTNGLDDTTITTETKYFVKISMSRKKIYFTLHYNTVNSFVC